MSLPAAVSRRRTFAIISHPDAGKTTLTEKLLLHGGAINMAGQVREAVPGAGLSLLSLQAESAVASSKASGRGRRRMIRVSYVMGLTLL